MYGNDNIPSYNRCQYLTVDGTSDTVTLSAQCKAVTLRAAAACWVLISPAPTAVKPSGEKVAGESFYLPANVDRIVATNGGTDAAPLLVAAIQDSSGGALYITEHFWF